MASKAEGDAIVKKMGCNAVEVGEGGIGGGGGVGGGEAGAWSGSGMDEVKGRGIDSASATEATHYK